MGFFSFMELKAIRYFIFRVFSLANMLKVAKKPLHGHTLSLREINSISLKLFSAQPLCSVNTEITRILIFF